MAVPTYTTAGMVAGQPQVVATPKAALDEIYTILNGNVEAANLAANAVTTVKLPDGAVIPAKRSTAVQGYIGFTSPVTPASTSAVTVMTVSVTSTGRPVLVTWACSYSNANSGAARTALFTAYVDAASQPAFTLDAIYVAGNNTRTRACDTFIVTPAAGSHTFRLDVSSSAANAIAFNEGSLTVAEL